MPPIPAIPILILWSAAVGEAPAAPQNVVSRHGDRSVVLHWDRNTESNLAGYNVYRASSGGGPFSSRTPRPLVLQSFADLEVTNGQTYFYTIRAVNKLQTESPDSEMVRVAPQPFADTDEFLDYVQATAFDYFWDEANPANGLIRDRTEPNSSCSIAAVGFGLTGICLGIDHGWITREQGRRRVLTTLQTFWQGPRGADRVGQIGYKGWFYHFLDMTQATRAGASELSSIDTALLLAGVLFCKQYFESDQPEETTIRSLAEAIYNRVDWLWMAHGGNSLDMGWVPESGFLGRAWIGYNEAMILYLLGIGANTNALPAAQWKTWTSGYRFKTYYGREFVSFPPLFGHQYSHCWIDFRHLADEYMRGKASTYFENSKRATLAQRDYCLANGSRGYSSNLWGLTACDGPGVGNYLGYSARGAPPPQNDDGTIAPTAAGGSIVFTPNESTAVLRNLYDRFRLNLWTGYGFRDAFNLEAGWWDRDVLGIDQGPILLMIENYRTKRVWNLFMKNPEIQRALEQAGFVRVGFLPAGLKVNWAQDGPKLSWQTGTNQAYQVEYSSNLSNWFFSETGSFARGTSQGIWTDTGPPGTAGAPAEAGQRFYRVFQMGSR